MSNRKPSEKPTLEAGQLYRTEYDSLVKLDRRVPGDPTKWFVVDFWNGYWGDAGNTVEPGDLAERVHV